MRPAEYTLEAIVQAGEALQAAGRNVTGFALRQRVGGGNPTRLKQVWDQHLARSSVTEAAPVAELPVEVAEELATVTRALTERLAALAVELNDKAVKAAERRVGEVVRAAGEQREQAERELADAAQTVEDLEHQLDGVKGELAATQAQLTEGLAQRQSQAVELAQIRERLSATEQAARTACEQHTAELKQLRDELAKAQARGEEAARMRGELDTLRAQNDALLAALKPAKPSGKTSRSGGAPAST